MDITKASLSKLDILQLVSVSSTDKLSGCPVQLWVMNVAVQSRWSDPDILSSLILETLFMHFRLFSSKTILGEWESWVSRMSVFPLLFSMLIIWSSCRELELIFPSLEWTRLPSITPGASAPIIIIILLMYGLVYRKYWVHFYLIFFNCTVVSPFFLLNV